MKDLLLVFVLTLVVGAVSALKTDNDLVQMKKIGTPKVYMTQN